MHKSLTHCLPNHISPEVFLRDYWQKQPLLIKNGLSALIGMFEPDDIIDLACEDDVLARLICQHSTPNQAQWTLKNSPLNYQDFDNTPKHWTVLIQNLEAWSIELGRLWQAFDFIPRWQQDDIMVSYAPDGGSVGAHYDDYDVFLAQGYGKRRWQLGKFCDDNTQFIPNQPIRLLDDMGEIIFDEILEAGDVLYVPPRLAHHGIAIGDCLTFSFGFRRPSLVQILDKLADVATSQPTLFKPLTLPQALQPNTNTLNTDSLNAIKNELISLLHSPQGNTLFCHAISELVSRRQYDLLKFDDDIDSKTLQAFLQDGGQLAINHANRFIMTNNTSTDLHIWYINGECVHLDDTAHNLLWQFLNNAILSITELKNIDTHILVNWVNDNWLIVLSDE